MELQHIRSFFTIQDNMLTAFAGTTYPLLPFHAKWHQDMAYKLKDPEANIGAIY